MNLGTQKVFAWSGLVCTLLFLFGFWVLAGFVPPPSPTTSVDSLVEFFSTDVVQKRAGLWLNTIAGALSCMFMVEISVLMRQIEGDKAHPLAWVQMLMAPLLVFEFIIPMMLWQACLYRPSMRPLFTYRLNDLTWLFFVGVVSTTSLACAAMGAAALMDKRSEPIFPRWTGYYNIFIAIVFLPGGLVPFFESGPLAWNGLISWWLVLTAFTAWLIVMSVVMLRYSIPLLERESRIASKVAGATA